MATDSIDRLNRALEGRYRVHREIGIGGMATVYLADDLRHRRRVAIKVLEPQLFDANLVDRFHREIEVAASLNHPLILPLYDSGQAAGCLFYVMPFAEGESLRDRLVLEPQLPVEEIVRVARDVAEALAYAHEHGVVHRDIKPSNILLSGDHAVLADFGIAQAIQAAGSEVLTSSGMMMGTPRYMSPEQAGGSGEVDGRSDLYALGCVLHEMIVGDPPFPGSSAQAVVAQQLGARPTPVRAIRPATPRWLERIVLRCLEKAPADRFPSAGALVEALRAGDREESPRRGGRRVLRVAGLLAAAAVVSLAVWRFAWTSGEPLSSNRIIVFPLQDLGDGAEGRGEQVAIVVGYTLEDTEPLRWLEGRDWLEPERRGSGDPLPVSEMTALSREHGARYFIDGDVVEERDSVRVILRLHDAQSEMVTARSGASDPTSEASYGGLGIRAVTDLLPAILEPDRQIDTSDLATRHPAAVANWLLGEISYRRAQFVDALEHFERALDQDPALGHAALGGAKAAAWLEQDSGEAEAWVTRALEYASALPIRHVHLARGLMGYLKGDADSALLHLERALAADSSWSEAWMTTGEVYRHLLTGSLAADSLAVDAYRAALAGDEEFSPALSHLAEFALRRGRVDEARELLDRFERAGPDTRFIEYLLLAERCMSQGSAAMDWEGPAVDRPFRVVQAGITLAGPIGDLACAEGAYRAAHGAPGVDAPTRWGALVGLQTLLLAQGRYDEIPPLLDGNAYGFFLYPFALAAGGPFEVEAAGAASRFGSAYEALDTPVLWAIGLWAAEADSLRVLDAVRAAARARATEGGARVATLVAAQLDAYAALAGGRRHEAAEALSVLQPTARKRNLLWEQWESLALERLWLARLLHEGGDYAAADSLARLLDHPQPISYLAVRPQALTLRAMIADSLGDPERAAVYRGRREALRH